MSITITAIAKGDPKPGHATYPATVTNGDFTIKGNPRATEIGDGNNEITTWAFDFSKDPQYGLFSNWLPLTSALLTLTLTPKNSLITTDAVCIEKQLQVVTPIIQGLPVGPTSTVVLQLLNWYTSDEILGWLFSGGGRLPMLYHDDCVVSFARLELTQRQAPVFQYAAKVVCGQAEGKILAQGIYHTAVNVHNPSDKPARFRAKVAVALPGEPGPISGFRDHELPPDGAIEFDCPQLWEQAQPPTELLKGFFVVESTTKLDVVAVYSAGGREGEVTSIHTERVPGRKRRRKWPDLVPVPHPEPGIGFCKLAPEGPDQGKLVVTIKNQGNAIAGASITRVDFRSGPSLDLPTPAIPAGASVDLPPVAIPGDCYRPDCHFTITADAKHEVDESDETNNTATGFCLG